MEIPLTESISIYRYTRPNIALYNYGVQYTTAAQWQLMYLSVPIRTIITSILFLWRQKITKNQIIGMIISTVWIVLSINYKLFDITDTILYGDSIILFGAFVHTLHTVISKKYQDDYNPRMRTAAFAMTSMIWCSIGYSMIPDISPYLPNSMILWLTVLLWIGSIGLHIMTQITNQKFWPLITSSGMYLQPLLGIVLAYLVLWEQTNGLSILWWLLAIFWAYLINKG
jgi:drug/metabolite transporter (DMT)-like permease